MRKLHECAGHAVQNRFRQRWHNRPIGSDRETDMRKRRGLNLGWILLAGVMPAAWAQVQTQAFVPETGFYWNSGQPGRGYAIEIQDRLVFMTLYTYTAEAAPSLREPLWFSAIGTLVASGSGSGVTYEFTDQLYFSEDGQCLGCPFPGEPLTTATGRPIRLTFDSVRSGELEIDGEIIPIERFWYANSILDAYLALEGQWLIVTDCTAPVQNNCYPSHPTIQPFEADLLQIDAITGAGNDRTAEGFRLGTPIEVAAAYQGEDDVFIIVVSEIDEEYLAYYFFGPDFGTDQFRGFAERYTPGANLTGEGFPMQGRRISDRTFAETLSPTVKRAGASDNGAHRAFEPSSRASRIEPAIDRGERGALKAAQLERLNRTLRRLERALARH